MCGSLPIKLMSSYRDVIGNLHFAAYHSDLVPYYQYCCNTCRLVFGHDTCMCSDSITDVCPTFTSISL